MTADQRQAPRRLRTRRRPDWRALVGRDVVLNRSLHRACPANPEIRCTCAPSDRCQLTEQPTIPTPKGTP